MTTVLATVPGSNGSEHRIIEARDGTPYCDCTGWKFSKASPKSCKHLERYLATANRRAVAVSSPAAGVYLGVGVNRTDIYQGDWLRDINTGFVMRAAYMDGGHDFQAIDRMWNIPAARALLFIPAGEPEHPDAKIARCDRETYRHAMLGRPVHMPTAPLDGPSVLTNLDWL